MQLTNNLANSKYLKKKLHLNMYNKFENVIKILYSNTTNFEKKKISNTTNKTRQHTKIQIRQPEKIAHPFFH